MTGCRRGKQIVKMEEVIDSVITERTGSIEEWMHQQESFRTFQASFKEVEKIRASMGHAEKAEKLWDALVKWDSEYVREVYIQGFHDHEIMANTKAFAMSK